jgi:hypothetical protein
VDRNRRGEPVETRDEDRRKEETTREILRYLLSNPDAEDTLEGIARWWLERSRIERTVREVRESLEILLKCGLVETSRGKTRPACYRMNRDKQSEIALFLQHDDSPSLSGGWGTDASSPI